VIPTISINRDEPVLLS